MNLFGVLALCLPLVTCKPSLEEQIAKKKSDISGMGMALRRMRFERMQEKQRDRFERSEQRALGLPEVRLDADAERMLNEAAHDLERMAAEDIEKARKDLRVLECRLEGRDGKVNEIDFVPDKQYEWERYAPTPEPCSKILRKAGKK